MKQFLRTILAGWLLAGVAGSALAAVSDVPKFGDFGLDLSGTDPSVRPGDDFFRYVNGTWLDRTEIPADRSNYGMFTVLDDLSKARTQAILQELRADPQSRAGRSYRSYLDQASADARGLDPIRLWLDHVRQTDRAHWSTLVAQAQRAGIRTMFPNYVAQDDRAPDQYAIKLVQGGLGMPDRDFYLEDGDRMQQLRSDYEAHLQRMLEFAGIDTDRAARAQAILQLETRIAEHHWSRTRSRDKDLSYNRLTLAELEKLAPGFDFKPILSIDGEPVATVLVSQPDAISAIARIWAEAEEQVLRDQLLVRSLESYASYLSDDIAEANFAFYGTRLSGTPERQPRWKRAVDFATAVVPDEISRIYVERHFPPETRAAMDDLVQNVLTAMGRRIDNLSWMSADTKQKARAKLARFTVKIGYPDRWQDYAGLDIQANDLFGNAWRSNQFDFDDDRSKIGQPIRRWEWFMTPMTINAYANFSMNEIVFPAAILQPPFFDPHADDAVNYGAIGAVIGHEISHHFDDQGSKYDADGRLKSWWSEEDRARFQALGEKLVAQYDAYEPFPGEFVQGALTLGENIGDLAGLAVALDAYHASLNGKAAPVIDGLSGDQRFFMAWAQVWRRKVREAEAHQRLRTDPHAPEQYRADIVRNFDAWYEAFRPEADGALVLDPDARVRIW